MIEIAQETGAPLDEIVLYMGRCSDTAFRAFSDRPSTLPMYVKSRLQP